MASLQGRTKLQDGLLIDDTDNYVDDDNRVVNHYSV